MCLERTDSSFRRPMVIRLPLSRLDRQKGNDQSDYRDLRSVRFVDSAFVLVIELRLFIVQARKIARVTTHPTTAWRKSWKNSISTMIKTYLGTSSSKAASRMIFSDNYWRPMFKQANHRKNTNSYRRKYNYSLSVSLFFFFLRRTHAAPHACLE